MPSPRRDPRPLPRAVQRMGPEEGWQARVEHALKQAGPGHAEDSTHVSPYFTPGPFTPPSQSPIEGYIQNNDPGSVRVGVWRRSGDIDRGSVRQVVRE